MNYLVTGGAGFIGSHLVEKLLGYGHNITVIDNFSTGKAENLPLGDKKLKIIEIDIRNTDEIYSLPTDYDGVFHLAALASVAESIDDPEKSYKKNSDGTFHMLEFSRRGRIPSFVMSSSAAVYGNTEKLPVAENDKVDPLSLYGLEKLHGELLCRIYANTYGLKTRALRFFNVYGPRQDPDSPYAGVISIFMKKLISGKTAIIYGDGTQTRDFFSVHDAVNALILAMNDERNLPFEVYNVGSGKETSIRELYNNICTIVGHSVVPEFRPFRTGDIRHSCADIIRMRRDLGFTPVFTLHEGLKELIQKTRISE